MTYKRTEENYASDRNYRVPIKDRLSEYELQKLDTEIQGYMIEKKLRYPIEDTIRVFDEDRWLRDKGAIGEKGIIVKNFVGAVYDEKGHLIHPQDCDPISWQQLQCDLDQWRKWKGRKEFGRRRGLDDLSRIAATMAGSMESKDRHYTESHARQHCTCIDSKHWINEPKTKVT